MPAQGRGANLKPSQVKAAPKAKPTPKPPNPFKGLAPPTRSIEQAAKKPVPKAGKSDKTLKREAKQNAKQEVQNQFDYYVRRNVGEGKMAPAKAVREAVKSMEGKVGEAPVRGKTPAERQQERSERKEFKRQQKADVAKTVQPNFFGIPVGGKESPLEAAREKSRGERVPKNVGIVAPPGIPGLAKLAGLAAAGKGLSIASKAVPGVGPKHLVSEASELAAAPFVGGVAAGKAGISAIEGNTAPAKKLIKGFTEGAVGEAAKGHFKEALKKAEEKPELAAFELGGLASAGGRLAASGLRAAGSTAEAGGIRGAMARGSHYVRPAIAGSEDAGLVKKGYVEKRTYSKNLHVRQRLADRRRKPLLEKHGNPVMVYDRGRYVPVLKGTAKERARIQKNQANYEAGRKQAVEHVEREVGHREAAKIEGRKQRAVDWATSGLRVKAGEWVAPMRVGEAITRLAAGGTIKHIGSAKADVRKYVGRVKKEIARHEAEKAKGEPGFYRDNYELDQAKQHVEMLENALRNPKVKWDSAVSRGIKYGRASREGDVRLKEAEVYEPEELEHGALSEYALAHMEAKWGTNEETGHEELLGADKQPLSVQAIEAHAHREGRAPETLGYVPHAVTPKGPGTHHIPFKVANRPVTPGHSRKGIVWARGGMMMTKQVLKDELVAKRVKANDAKAVDEVVNSAGAVKPDGEYFTAESGPEAARRLTVDTGEPWFAVRTVPAKRSEQGQKAIKNVQDPAAMETAHAAMLNDRIIRDAVVGDKTPNVVLMPGSHLQTLSNHLMHPGDTARLMQMMNGPFRMAVLPQPRWLTGNFIEPYFVRLPLSGAGVNIPGSFADFFAMKKVLNHLENSGDPRNVRAALQIRAMHTGGLFIGKRGASYHRTWEGFEGKDAQAIYYAHVVRNLPVTKQMADMILTVPHTFFTMNRIIESAAQKLALGKSIRSDAQAITGSWIKSIKLSEKVLDQVMKGAVDPVTQHRWMKEQYEMLGQYAGFSPRMRWFINTVAPFIPWTLNSVRFAYWTLPVKHTAVFASLARLANEVQAEWEAEHKNVPKGELKYAIPSKDGGWINLARYTPFSIPIAAQQGDYRAITNSLFPVATGALAALKGEDVFGRDLQVPKTKANPEGKATSGQKGEIALNTLIESLVPGVATARRLKEGGGTGYSTSTLKNPQVKPDTQHGSALERTFNPFQPVYLKKNSRAKKGKGRSHKPPSPLGPKPQGPPGASHLGV